MAEIRFYNTLTHQLEWFKPSRPPEVLMYNCGPTVYDFAHIGNFKTFLVSDVLRRFLELSGYEVNQVMNLTDVGHMTEDQVADGGGEDKMEAAARRLAEAKKAGLDAPVDDPRDPYQVAEYYIQAFVDDARAVGMRVAEEYPDHMPRATSYIEPMQAMIGRLIDTGHAYVADDGAVYYSIESFPEYGRLSGNTVDQLRGGAGGRVQDAHQKGKRHPADFLLWKADASHLMKWASPWGVGYPGWHIECSVMATQCLGDQVIDIHTGGEDNIFPHHECEIAQSVGAADPGKLAEHGDYRGFARYWLHSRHLMVDGEKMSKSKGNFHTVRDVLGGKVTGRRVDPAVFRYAMIRAHYRTNIDFGARALEESASAVQRLRDADQAWAESEGEPSASVDADHPVVGAFLDQLSDDLNMAGALGVVFEFINDPPTDNAEARAVLHQLDRVLSVLPRRDAPATPGQGTPADDGNFDVQAKCAQLDQARASKDFDTADRLRAQLIEAGYEVHTTKAGTTAKQKLA